MRLVRFRHGDRIATGAIQAGTDTIQVLAGTFFEDPLPTGETVELTRGFDQQVDEMTVTDDGKTIYFDKQEQVNTISVFENFK